MNKITEKWRPIIDVYNYSGNKLDKIALYLENHSYLESLMFEKAYCMPVALKILIGLENLNLENLAFNITEKGVTEHKVDIYLEADEEVFSDMNEIEKTIYFEYKLIEAAIEKIDNSIKTLNTDNTSEIIFETNLLVGGIDIVKETDRPKMRIKLNYSLKAKQK